MFWEMLNKILLKYILIEEKIIDKVPIDWMFIEPKTAPRLW